MIVAVHMVIHNGIRYRPEDAERLGIKAEAEDEHRDKAVKAAPRDKAARPVRRRTKGADGGEHADDDPRES